MKKIVITSGIIAGLIAAAWCVGSIGYCYATGKFEGSMLVGYTAMVVAFSLIFPAVKNYRDNHLGGIISFGKAFKIGALISVIGSTIYVLAWVIDYYLFIPDFMDKLVAHTIKQVYDSGATAEVIAKKTKEAAEMKNMYSTPFGVIFFTYLEILPVGLLVACIASLILKRTQPEPQVTTI